LALRRCCRYRATTRSRGATGDDCTILSGGQVVYESGRITVYYRRDAAGRLLMGGRGYQRGTNNPRHYHHLTSYARALWPSLEQAEWTHWWNGQFAVTPDFLPRFHRPEQGIYILLGYSGRGLALAPALGAELAAVLAGAQPESPLRLKREVT
jgi:glycine/D-amino acid oxidase-like deaminating enzyme